MNSASSICGERLVLLGDLLPDVGIDRAGAGLGEQRLLPEARDRALSRDRVGRDRAPVRAASPSSVARA